MSLVEVQLRSGIATVVLQRGPVNALNPAVIEELSATFRNLQSDTEASAVVLTGRGKFFSFGFDIPELLSHTRAEFTRYLTSFTTLYRDLFVYPKPLVAALNGHAIAGGCMIALACDSAIMVQGSAKIGLNEIGFGSSIFAGSTEMLQFRTGSRASDVLYSGAMYSPAEAQEIGLVAEVVAPEALLDRAREIAGKLASRRPAAFASIKSLLRKPVAEAMASREAASIREFVDIWYSEPTWTNLRNITIRRAE
jgi:enoyl-CoA hydratase/carnithine racemase